LTATGAGQLETVKFHWDCWLGGLPQSVKTKKPRIYGALGDANFFDIFFSFSVKFH
jgi:hypothetical protein